MVTTLKIEKLAKSVRKFQKHCLDTIFFIRLLSNDTTVRCLTSAFVLKLEKMTSIQGYILHQQQNVLGQDFKMIKLHGEIQAIYKEYLQNVEHYKME